MKPRDLNQQFFNLNSMLILQILDLLSIVNNPTPTTIISTIIIVIVTVTISIDITLFVDDVLFVEDIVTG